MRNLIYIPIVHTEADLGSMANAFKKEYSRQYSNQHYQQHIQSVDQMWEQLTRNVTLLDLNWAGVRLYQDGLPVCGRELEIVRDLAQKGSKNHQLLQTLIVKGATLEGTEDKNLLLEEYHHFQKIFAAILPSEKKRLLEAYKPRSETLLRERDQFIANRIASTLQENENGLLFIGMLHKVDQYLPSEIQVNSLIYRLPFDKMAKV